MTAQRTSFRLQHVPRLIAIIVALAMTGCGYTAKPAVSSNDCAVPPGLPAGQLLLFGEMHGSVETPALMSELACALSKSGVIAVGLELPSRDQPRIDTYLDSHGTRKDEEALTSSDFWQIGRDGRSSTAMLGLIEDIRALRQDGHSVDLFAFDEQTSIHEDRNVAIADGIRRFHALHPRSRIIALMGSIHAMQREMPTSTGVVVPSGRLLADLNPVSVLISYPKGTIWTCMSTCGVQDIAPRTPSTGPTGFQKGASWAGYSHSFLLPSITASPPAVQR